MDAEEQTDPEAEFVSPYGWLLAPGDHMQADYTSPTVVKSWLVANEFSLDMADQTDPAIKQRGIVYGQWIAQLLQNQLNTHPKLVSLYHPTQADSQNLHVWPITLRSDVVLELDDYFSANKDQPCPPQ